MTALAALLLRDARLAVRVGGGALIGVLFFLIVVTLVPFAIAAMATLHRASTAVGIYAESALGTLVNLQQPGTMAAEQTFYLAMTGQVSTLVPQIRDGKIDLPAESDLSKLVDWDKVRACEAQ